MTRVLIVAASAVVRAGLEALVASSPGLSVVGRTAQIDALLAETERVAPDVVLIDFKGEGDELVPTLLALGEGSATPPAAAVLTDNPAALWAAVVARSTVRAVLPREASAEAVVAAVHGAAAGLIVLSPSVIEAFAPPQLALAAERFVAGDNPLTPREIEILGMLAEGLGNKVIARRLGISDHTVKFHVGSIMSKLGASSRTEAVTLGVRRGLIML